MSDIVCCFVHFYIVSADCMDRIALDEIGENRRTGDLIRTIANSCLLGCIFIPLQEKGVLYRVYLKVYLYICLKCVKGMESCSAIFC